MFIMRVFPLLVLAAVLACAHASTMTQFTKASFKVGNVFYGDKLLQRHTIYRPAVANVIQTEEFIYRGNFTTRISGVYATEVGYPQYATVWLVSGGVGYNNVTLRIQSRLNYGYYYIIDVWGQ